jgi:hypothetical protein
MPNDLVGTTITSGTLMVPSARPGAQGLAAWSGITAAFTVPAIGTPVTVEFANADWVEVDAVIFIAGMYGRVTARSGTSVTLERLDDTGVIVGPQGPPGPPGPQPEVPIPMVFNFLGRPSSSFTVTLPIAIAVTLPADLAGSIGNAETPPSDPVSFTLTRNGSTLTFITVDTLGNFTFNPLGSEVQIVVGDIIAMVAPGIEDPMLENVGITLLVTRT